MRTGAWGTYATIPIVATLAAGTSTISVTYDSSRGSANWLNLDHLILTGDAPEHILLSTPAISPPGTARLTWNARPRHIYQLQYRSLTSNNWADLGPRLIATNSSATAADNVGAGTSRVYRVYRTY